MLRLFFYVFIFRKNEIVINEHRSTGELCNLSFKPELIAL
jgi:hypothetical protein